MARRHSTPDHPDGSKSHPPVGARAGEGSLRWWLAVVLGLSSIAVGITIQVVPDASLRVVAAVIGVVLALRGIASLRRLVPGWTVLAHLVATTWLLSGLFQLVIAAVVGGRLLALGAVTTVVGTAFAVWPRSTGVVRRPAVPAPASASDTRGPDMTEVEPRDVCSRSFPGSFHRLRSSDSGSSVLGPWTPRSSVPERTGG